MRLPLPDGNHADLRGRLTYAQARPVRAAFVAVEADRAALVDLDIALVRAYVAAWHVLDLDGVAVPLDTPENAPDDAIQAIALAAIEAWKGSTPKGTTALSATTSKARRSK